MLTNDFDFDLPQKLIAHFPAKPADSARMLLVSNEIADLGVKDIPKFLNKGDVVVFNNTKVIPARLFGARRGSKVEVTLHECVKDGLWKAFAKPARKLSPGDIVDFAGDFKAEVMAKDQGEVVLNFKTEDFYSKLEQYGIMPLPPYIDRKSGEIKQDRQDYQTIFAKNKGAVAAPTAGLHFTEELLADMKKKQVEFVEVTLHVGAGTFLPVKSENIKDHKMHSENYEMSKESAKIINQAKQNGNKVVAIGTTSLRVLESVTDEQGEVKPGIGKTDIFIYPGYKFKLVDVLLTNFHLPKSTLFMLVCAFSGVNKMKNAYDHAIKNEYRFFSYGDACLLMRA